MSGIPPGIGPAGEGDENLSYKETFIVSVTLSPGNGYENGDAPSINLMKNAIRRAFAESLNPSDFISSKVNSVKRKAKAEARED